MPLYDYACPDCGLAFEVSRSFADSDKPAICPMCNVEAKRQLTVPLSTYTRGGYAEKARDSPAPSSFSSGSRWSHGGHSHGAGTSSHTH